jgi:U4/U6.U5 tri-snRNP-associated protein 2
LDDIKFNLQPRYSRDELRDLPDSALSLTGSEYYPGLVGLNQIKDSSYLNSVMHALCAVVPLRDWFLTEDPGDEKLACAFGELLRKINNPRSFKGITSPHEFVQQVSLSSNNEFFANAADPFKFLDWFLPTLQAGIRDRIVLKTFQGSSLNGSFLTISMKLPPMPVFKDEKEMIPTVAIRDIVSDRFGKSGIVKFPEYLIMHFKRFEMNNFFMEKNTTLVRFPLTGLDLTEFATDPSSSVRCKYSLVSTICHEGKADGGTYKAYVIHPVSDQWFECQALRIKKVIPQSVAVVESYIQIWRLEQ